MHVENERGVWVPVIIASAVLAISVVFLWFDLMADVPGRGNGMITSATVSRAGAVVTPSEAPADLVPPPTVPASDSPTLGRSTR